MVSSLLTPRAEEEEEEEVQPGDLLSPALRADLLILLKSSRRHSVKMSRSGCC